MKWLAKNKLPLALGASVCLNVVLYGRWDIERAMRNYVVESRAHLIESLGKHGGIEMLEKVTEDMQLFAMEKEFQND